MTNKFGVGDIVRIKRGTEFTCKVVTPILDDYGWWYEVRPIDFEPSFNREVKEDDLELVG